MGQARQMGRPPKYTELAVCASAIEIPHTVEQSENDAITLTTTKGVVVHRSVMQARDRSKVS